MDPAKPDKLKEKESFEIKQSIAKMVCTLCAQEFVVEENVTRCPYDRALLAPVMADAFIGTVLAEKYAITDLLGFGGFAHVYKATQLSLNRTVAIKVLEPHLVANLEAVKRFEHEAKIVSLLIHGNIVAVVDYGLVPQPYLVMEFLEGDTLERLIDGNPVPLEMSLKIFTQICDGMQAAHKFGIIHRDLKPSNIMLVPSKDGETTVKILDFGVAKLGEDAVKSMSELTRSGETMGSPPYMSPEQCYGRTPDARSDIYSLACLMYETLTGEPPFGKGNSVELMHKHMKQTPPPLSFRHASLKIPLPIEKVLLTGMEKEADDRYQTMEEMKEDLLFAAQCTMLEYQKKHKGRKKSKKQQGGQLQKIVIISAVSGLIIIGTGVGAYWQWSVSGAHSEKVKQPAFNDPALMKKLAIAEELLRDGNTQQAGNIGADLARTFPDSPLPQILLGRVKLSYANACERDEKPIHKRIYELAIDFSTDAIKKEKLDPRPYLVRIQAYCKVGDFVSADKDMRMLTVLAPAQASTKLMQALVFYSSGKRAEAAEVLKSIRPDEKFSDMPELKLLVENLHKKLSM